MRHHSERQEPVREDEDQEAILGEKEETDGALLGDSSTDITQAAGRTAPTVPDPLQQDRAGMEGL